ncbi:sporulation histidine kinase inhibitor Sda [Alteribacillus sp. JSM 102045]
MLYIYRLAKEKYIEKEFIDILKQEINRRGKRTESIFEK